MEGLSTRRLDAMGRLNNVITVAIDKSPCSIIEALFVLKNIENSIRPLVLSPKKPETPKDG